MRSGPGTRLLPAGLIAAAAVLPYLRTLAAPFVYDDVPNVLHNPWIRSARFLPEVLGSQVAAFDVHYATSYYRPLMHVLYMGVHAVAGPAPAAYHALNLVLHAACSLLVYAVARRALGAGARVPALAAALVFAVHPVHVEAVAWVAGITDLSYSVLGLAAVLVFLREERPFGPGHAWAGLLVFVAALGKEPALAIPLVCLAGDAGAVPWRTLASRLAPQAAGVAAYLGLRAHALGGLAPAGQDLGLSGWGPLLNGPVLLVRDLAALLAPVRLSVIHEFVPVTGAGDPRFLGSLAILAVMASAAWRRRAHRELRLAAGLVVFPLLPTLYLRGVGEGVFAERYLYLPVAGLGLLLAAALARVPAAPRPRRALAAAGVALLVAAAAATAARARVWAGEEALWSDAVRKAPGSARAHANLGFALYAQGRLPEAVEAYRRSLDRNPRDADVQVNMGVALSALGRSRASEEAFRAALTSRPDHAEALSGLGDALRAQGRTAEAEAAFRAALSVAPQLAPAHNGLGACLAARGDLAGAVQAFGEAARLDPGQPIFGANLERARRMAAGGGP